MANFPGTAGDDPLVGTNQDDTFDLTLGGNDSVTAGAGDDRTEEPGPLRPLWHHQPR